MKQCKTCNHWNFKSSGETDDAWGECLSQDFNRMVKNSLPLALAAKYTNLEIAQHLKSECNIRVNEQFGCVFHNE